MTDQGGDHVAGVRRPRVSNIVAQLLGTEPLDVQTTPSPDVWFVALTGGRTVVVKMPGSLNRPGSVRVEAWAYNECRRRGIRVPEVLAISQSPECIILERLPGESLPYTAPSMSAEVRATWARAGEDLRAIHEVRLSGFGPLAPGSDEPTGQATRWCPLVDHARNDGLPWLANEGFLLPAEADRLARRFDEASQTFNQITQGRLLHGDLMCTHIFRSPAGTYEGIIDFGQAQAGDPRWDLARIRLWDGDTALNAVLDGYGTDTVSKEDRDFLLPLYLLSFAVHHAVGHDRPDYIRMLLAAADYRDLL